MISRAGIPYESGLPKGDANPVMSHSTLVGANGEKGLLGHVANHPNVFANSSRRARSLYGRTISIVKPTLPESEEADLLAQYLEVQWPLAQRQWRFWNTPGTGVESARKTLRLWIEMVSMTVSEYGFFIGEIPKYDTADGWVLLGLPLFINPSTVKAYEWSGGQFIGAHFGGPGIASYEFGTDEPTTDYFVPAEDLLIVSQHAQGTNLSGKSALRTLIHAVRRFANLEDQQDLALGRRGPGELFFVPNEGASPLKEDDPSYEDIQTYYDERGVPGSRVTGLIVPPGYKPMILSSGSDVSDLSATLGRIETTINTAQGAEDRGMALGGEGSHAARRVASGDAKLEVESDFLSIVENSLHSLFARLFVLNEVAGEPEDPWILLPQIQSIPVETRTASAQAALLTELVRDGLITWTPSDEMRLRSQLGWEADPKELEEVRATKDAQKRAALDQAKASGGSADPEPPATPDPGDSA